MGPAAKWEYMKKTYERYIKANRKQKSKILDEFCATYECHRKSAIRLMSKGAATGKAARTSSSRINLQQARGGHPGIGLAGFRVPVVPEAQGGAVSVDGGDPAALPHHAR